MKYSSFQLLVMDWGIGGLNVYNEIKRLHPHLSILYFSDSVRTPYGKMTQSELKSRIREIIFFFAKQNIRHYVIACNAASTVLPSLAEEFKINNIKVTGVIEHGVGLIQKSNFKNVGVIGGRRTILSRHYTTPFANKKRHVFGRIAQPLSALIEKGELSSPHMLNTLKQILGPLKNCDALVLACTHYPAITPLIRKLLPDCKLINPAEAVAKFVKADWKLASRSVSKSEFLCSGSGADMIKSAQLAFATRIPKVTKLNI